MASAQQVNKVANENVLLDMTVLTGLRELFSNSTIGLDILTEAQFREGLEKYICAEDVDLIYPKIDINDDGFVEWNEFTSYLIAKEGKLQKISLSMPCVHSQHHLLLPMLLTPHRKQCKTISF